MPISQFPIINSRPVNHTARRRRLSIALLFNAGTHHINDPLGTIGSTGHLSNTVGHILKLNTAHEINITPHFDVLRNSFQVVTLIRKQAALHP